MVYYESELYVSDFYQFKLGKHSATLLGSEIQLEIRLSNL